MKKVLIAALLGMSLIAAGFLLLAFAEGKQDLKLLRQGETISESMTESENQEAKTLQKTISFGNGDTFWIRRYMFKNNSAKPYYSAFSIPGNTIRIQYMVTEGNQKKWVEITDPSKLNTPAAKTTLFITTDKHSMVIGVPGVYKEQAEYGNLEVQASKEKPVSITKTDGKYMIRFSFARDQKYIGEIWALQSAKPLFVLDDAEKQIFTTNDLAGKWRFSMGGYYQKTYDSYIPTGPNVYFRQPACYAGGTFLRVRSSNATYDLGYALMKICSANQNEMGYIPTPSRSTWLYRDFQIQEGFYDTRFNTDFGMNLLDAYWVYQDEYFLEKAKNYGRFYVNYAAENSYKTQNGILVSDYWHEKPHLKTHVSLNHHLAGLNFMLKLYGQTNEQAYLDTALGMTRGVEDTEQRWILPDGNLGYALFYEGPNLMVDYPYLTYNDLYTADEFLRRYAKIPSAGIQHLMESKKGWMIKNDVHGYLGE